MKEYFKGYYLKHQIDDDILSLIIGENYTGKFVQIITRDFSVVINNHKGVYLTKDYLVLNINNEEININGKIEYIDKTPIKYDIMGFFAYLPLECRHYIFSMKHKLKGRMTINNKTHIFDNGIGYIEGDSGHSFPKKYLWLQANDFSYNTSFFVAVADVPVLYTKFKGCIAIVNFKGVEHRFATYLGVKIIKAEKNKIILRQGNKLLIIKIYDGTSHILKAPVKGDMTRNIKECVACKAEFEFYIGNDLVFDGISNNVSFEYVQ